MASAVLALFLAAVVASADAALYVAKPGVNVSPSSDVNVRVLSPELTVVMTTEAKATLPADQFDLLPMLPSETAFVFYVGNASSAVFKPLGAVVLLRSGELAIVSSADTYALDRLPFAREVLAFLPAAPAPAVRRPISFRNDSLKQEIVDLVDSEEHLLKVKTLSGALGIPKDGGEFFIQTRFTGTQDNVLSSQYIQATLAGYGYQTIIQPFTFNGRSTINVIGIKTGTVSPEEIIVVGGHFDSTSENPNVLAPGAIDDASGTAAMLHIAEIYAGFETEKTIHFVAFSGEEQGLYGSRYYVSQLSANGWVVLNALILDMVSYSNNYFGVVIEGTPAYTSLISLTQINHETYAGNNLVVTTSTRSGGSDHVPFQQAGIPAVLSTERDPPNSYPAYHRTTDTWEYVNQQLSESIIRGNVATLYDLATPVQPKSKLSKILGKIFG